MNYVKRVYSLQAHDQVCLFPEFAGRVPGKVGKKHPQDLQPVPYGLDLAPALALVIGDGHRVYVKPQPYHLGDHLHLDGKAG